MSSVVNGPHPKKLSSNRIQYKWETGFQISKIVYDKFWSVLLGLFHQALISDFRPRFLWYIFNVSTNIILDSVALTYIANLKNYCKKGTQRRNLQQEMNKKNWCSYDWWWCHDLLLKSVFFKNFYILMLNN